MQAKTGIAILGAGKIGRAAHSLLCEGTLEISNLSRNLAIFDAAEGVEELDGGRRLDLGEIDVETLAAVLKEAGTGYVINALPFFLNVKVAMAAALAGCNYIDFTEDDEASDAVQRLYANQTELMCATKCGLAPGFVNYVGASLVEQVKKAGPGVVVDHLRVRVGALPANIRFEEGALQDTYAMSWSIDGLVNEYIRPCRVKQNGGIVEKEALLGEETIVINGSTYEACYTSGGVGSLLTDFPEIANIDYKTLRYPGHYAYVHKARHLAGWGKVPVQLVFEQLRDTFKRDLAWTNNDIIVVFAEATGRDEAGNRHVRNFAAKYGQVWPLTGIQATTAGGALAVLELMMDGKLSKPVITHRDVHFNMFLETRAFRATYGAAKCS